MKNHSRAKLNPRLSLFFLSLLVLILASCTGILDSTSTDSANSEATTNNQNTNDTTTEEELPQEGETVTTASGLQITHIQTGNGAAPQSGDIVQVHYTGTLEDGTKFDSSVDRGQPFAFPLGQGRVIRGWDEGIALLQVGGKAKLEIPPELGYGERGAGNVIPANATLIFEVELVDILPGAPAAPTEVDEADYTVTESGLKYYDFEVGDGATPEAGQTAVVHYTGWLTDGTKFDSSLDRGETFAFPLGQGRVIRGWDEGVATMKIGGKRQLVIPPDLGYGERGAGNVIPANATLIFEVELVGIQ